MLKIDKIEVKIKNSDKTILKDFSLNIGTGEIHAIMGPNGTGKSTLAKVLMGHYKYEVVSGKVFFQDKDITTTSVDERAKMRMFLGMQDPTEIDGISNSEFLRTALKDITGKHVNLYSFIKDLDEAVADLLLDESMIHRSLNKGFSGGEKKKNEVLQLKILKPELIILDELDSGLDVDSLKVVCQNINKYLESNKTASLLIITHYPRILEYLKPDYVHVMQEGNIKKTGSFDLAKSIEKEGYNSINAMR